MDRIRIVGGKRLNGTIPISGAKNATLPLMIASLLTPERLTLENVPSLADVVLLGRILGNHGVDLTVQGKRANGPGANGGNGLANGHAGANNHGFPGRIFHLQAEEIVDTTAPYDMVSRMRASFWVLGPLLARMGEARVSLPGGCAIGTRPVDLHLMGLEKLGAEISIDEGYVVARAPKGLSGNRVVFEKVSVGATHNVMMAATLAKGETVIENAAREPEIVNVAECLRAMGAVISGEGTAAIRIQGGDTLRGARHRVLPDRIETGTYAMAVAMTGGEVHLEGAEPALLQAALDVLVEAGVSITPKNDGITVARNGHALRSVNVSTAPFPGFPTDLQAQLMTLMTRADGTSTIRETIFENRFMHVQELARLGAEIKLDGDTATISGNAHLKGAQVMATDLRASVSLVIAGLAAEGETTVNRVYHLDRGFERLEQKLSACGAEIERLTG